MTYEEYIQLYGSADYSQLRRWARSDDAFRVATASLHRAVFGVALAVSCSDCYADAALNLIKKYPKNKTLMESKYKLKSGAIVLRDVRNLSSNEKMATRHNLTDELAKYHLYTNPSCVNKFATLPDNWEEEVAEYGRLLDAEGTKKEAGPTTDEEVAEEAGPTPPEKKPRKTKTAKAAKK